MVERTGGSWSNYQCFIKNVDCVGSWVPLDKCESKCDKRIEQYQITTLQNGDGLNCEANDKEERE